MSLVGHDSSRDKEAACAQMTTTAWYRAGRPGKCPGPRVLRRGERERGLVGQGEGALQELKFSLCLEGFGGSREEQESFRTREKPLSKPPC